MDLRYLDRLAGNEPRDRPADVHRLCAFCGYDLFGGVSNCCPECGNAIDPQAMREQTDEVKAQQYEFEEALRFLPLAWKLVALGSVLFLLRITPVLGPGLSWLARSLGFLCGFVALFLRLAVIRSGKLPDSAISQEQRMLRDSFLGALEIAGGLFLMGTAIGLK
jgi:hypothetical protein